MKGVQIKKPLSFRHGLHGISRMIILLSLRFFRVIRA